MEGNGRGGGGGSEVVLFVEVFELVDMIFLGVLVLVEGVIVGVEVIVVDVLLLLFWSFILDGLINLVVKSCFFCGGYWRLYSVLCVVVVFLIDEY